MSPKITLFDMINPVQTSYWPIQVNSFDTKFSLSEGRKARRMIVRQPGVLF